MMILLALLLVMDLPQVETNVTVAAKQAANLKCHVCEIENSFSCIHPTTCPKSAQFCTSVAVRMYPRFYIVSKQCSRYCPIGAPLARGVQPFVLMKPTPFLYVHCCAENLCNTPAPLIRDPVYREGGRAGGVRSRGAWLLVLLALSST